MEAHFQLLISLSRFQAGHLYLYLYLIVELAVNLAVRSQRVQTLREKLVVESLILLMPMATKFDQRKKIKKLVKNKRNQKNNLAKNFLLTNFNLIAKNNLNI